MNNAYPFPAKPRNQWEIGAKGGVSNISGDVRTVFPTWGWGLHVRKALGYTFSLRLEYTNLQMKGLNWQPSYYGYAANGGLNNIIIPIPIQQYFTITNPTFSPFPFRVLPHSIILISTGQNQYSHLCVGWCGNSNV
jgi:hypothetical protein